MKRRSLVLRLVFFGIGMVLSVLVVVSTVLYVRSSQLFKDEVASHTTHEIDASAAYIQQYLSNLRATTRALVASDAVNQYLQGIGDGEVLRLWIQTILATNPHFVSVVLIAKDGRLLSNGPTDDMVTSSDMMSQDWYQQALKESGVPVLSASRMQQGRYVISISQEVTDASGDNLGVVRLDIDYHALATYLKELALGEQGVAFVMNRQGELVYHPDDAVIASSEKQMSVVEIANEENSSMMSESFFVHKSAVEGSDWIVVGVSSFGRLRQYSWQLLLVVASVAVAAFVSCAVGMTVVIRRWLRPLATLEDTMQMVERGETSQRAVLKGAVEFEQLADHFNRMLDQVEQLMAQTHRQERLARQYELKALASQINPHFLYNTLETIIWMAEFNEPDRVVAVTKALSQYFRLALNHGEDLIELRLEVEQVRQYLLIQKERYGERLSYTIDVSEAVPAVVLPKLVLQPLVENAIYHGIKEVNRPGMIQLTVKVDFPYIVISVYDNGVGMSQSATDHRLGGVGIQNVRERLQLYFGAAFRMEIDSQPNQYTQVTLYLPIASAEKENL